MSMTSINPSILINKAKGLFMNVAPDAADLKAVKRFVNCGLSNHEHNLLDEVKQRAPRLIREVDGMEYISTSTLQSNLVQGVRSFVRIPLDMLNALAARNTDSALYNSRLLRKYRENVDLDTKINSLRGLYENGIKYTKDVMKANQKTEYPIGPCTPECKDLCGKVSHKFTEALNEVMSDTVANYDTKKERLAARLVSGFTAAWFMGGDFFNKAIKEGQTVEEAKKDQHKKQGQEFIENVCEGLFQFGIFSVFSKQVNGSATATALIGMGISIFSRIFSRMIKGLPIARIKAPDKVFRSYMPSIKEYIASTKENKTKELFESKQIKKAEDEKVEKKKPYLTLKRVIGICGASIVLGYALRAGKKHTQIGRAISDFFARHQENFNAAVTQNVEADPETLTKLSKIMRQAGEEAAASDILKVRSRNATASSITLGTEYKTMNILGINVRTKDVRSLWSAPFRTIKEIVTKPYQMVNKGTTILDKKIDAAVKKFDPAAKKQEGFVNKTLKKIYGEPLKAGDAPKKGLARLIDILKNHNMGEKRDVIVDSFDIKNIYQRFLEFQKKYPNDDIKLADEFSKYVKEMRLASTDKVGSSKGDNSQIAVMMQILSTIAGLWFNMNDEFNTSIQHGKTKKEAEKAARLRGLNKFIRMSVQVVIVQTLNSMFAKQYNNSILKAGATVAVCTVLTDAVSRLMSGMPLIKMSKEDLIARDERLQDGFYGKYCKFVDKLAS